MNRALLMLIGMRYRAHARRLFSGSTKRRAMSLIGVILIALWILSTTLIAPSGSSDPKLRELLRWPDYALAWAFALFIYMPFYGGARRGGLALSPAEVDQLLPGPFLRREIVLYKLTHLAGIALLTSLWLCIFFTRQAATFGQAFLTLLLVLLVATALGIVGTLLRDGSPAQRRLHTALLWLIPAMVLGSVAELCIKAGQWPTMEHLKDAHTGRIGNIITYPGLWAVELFRGETLPQWLTAAGILVVVLLMLVWLLLKLSDRSMENAIAASADQARRLEQMMRRGVSITDAGKAAKRRLPMLPRLGGVGPIAWRQLTELYRGAGLRQVIIILAIVGGYGYLAMKTTGTNVGPMVLTMPLVMTCFIIPGIFKLDFRADLDQMDTLKALPLPALAIAAGQMVAPTTLLVLAHVLTIGIVGSLAGISTDVLIALAIASPPVALLMVAVENVVFLWMPTRPGVFGVASPQAAGRGVLLLLVRLLLLLPAFAATGGIVWLVHTAGGALITSILAGALCLGIAAFIALIGVAYSFKKFDVIGDMPA